MALTKRNKEFYISIFHIGIYKTKKSDLIAFNSISREAKE